MISDSPYDAGESVLTQRCGIASGLVAAVLMLAIVFALEPISGLSLRYLLMRIGSVALPGGVRSQETLVLSAGVALHALLGALFGLVYAACQQRIPPRGLISVGIFYGFVLSIVGNLLVGSLFGEALRATVRAWPWLLACLLYGLCLSAVAIWSESQRPAGATIVASKD